MKQLLLFFLLATSLRAAGQVSPLPIDSASGRVTYRGAVSTPGASAAALLERARAVASTVPVSGEQPANAAVAVRELPLGHGRTLRYRETVRVQSGGYAYELSDFENKTADAHYAAATGALATATGGAAPLERVLANPDGYRKGKPTAALLAYRAAVHKAAGQAVADLKQRMKLSSH